MRIGLPEVAFAAWLLCGCSDRVIPGNTSVDGCGDASSAKLTIPANASAHCADSSCLALFREPGASPATYRVHIVDGQTQLPGHNLPAPLDASGDTILAGVGRIEGAYVVVSGARTNAAVWRHAIDFVGDDDSVVRVEGPAYEAPAPTAWIATTALGKAVVVVPRWGTLTLGGFGYLVGPATSQPQAFGSTVEPDGIWRAFKDVPGGFVGARLGASKGATSFTTKLHFFDPSGLEMSSAAQLDDAPFGSENLAAVSLVGLSDGRVVVARLQTGQHTIALLEVYDQARKRVLRTRYCHEDLAMIHGVFPRADDGWMVFTGRKDGRLAASHFAQHGQLVMSTTYHDSQLADNVDAMVRILKGQASAIRSAIALDAWGRVRCTASKACLTCEDSNPCTVGDCDKTGSCRQAAGASCPFTADEAVCAGSLFPEEAGDGE